MQVEGTTPDEDTGSLFTKEELIEIADKCLANREPKMIEGSSNGTFRSGYNMTNHIVASCGTGLDAHLAHAGKIVSNLTTHLPLPDKAMNESDVLRTAMGLAHFARKAREVGRYSAEADHALDFALTCVEAFSFRIYAYASVGWFDKCTRMMFVLVTASQLGRRMPYGFEELMNKLSNIFASAAAPTKGRFGWVETATNDVVHRGDTVFFAITTRALEPIFQLPSRTLCPFFLDHVLYEEHTLDFNDFPDVHLPSQFRKHNDATRQAVQREHETRSDISFGWPLLATVGDIRVRSIFDNVLREQWRVLNNQTETPTINPRLIDWGRAYSVASALLEKQR